MTLEEAQELILKLTEEAKAHELAMTTLTEADVKAKARIVELQEHNQKLFLQALKKDEPVAKDEPETVSIEAFAKTLKF